MERDNYIEVFNAESVIYKNQEWRKWSKEIPYIPIKNLSEYEVRAIPPFGGAVIRYNFRNPKNEKFCSIFLDCYDRLGCFGEPYWEIYPYSVDVTRVSMEEVDRLVELIIEVMEDKCKD